MKNVINKIGEVLYDVVKFIVAAMLLALWAGIFALACAIMPILGLAFTIAKGGSLFDNTCEITAEFIDMWTEIKD